MHSLPGAFNLNLITMPVRMPTYNKTKIIKNACIHGNYSIQTHQLVFIIAVNWQAQIKNAGHT
jgi:hypothetical protein